jgi:hypothetical protein
MFAANAHVIRPAVADDAQSLRELAELDSQRPLTTPALVGELDGRPAAAISMADGRVVADPFKPTAKLTPLLRMRRDSLRALERTPSLRERICAAVRVTGAWAPSA